MIIELNFNCSWRGNYIDVMIDERRIVRIGIYGSPGLQRRPLPSRYQIPYSLLPR